MKKWTIVLMAVILVVAGAGWLWGSATWRHNVTKGMTVGDIPYADKSDRLTNLNAAANGKVLQAAGAATAPAYVAKNIMRVASHNFATTATKWTLSSDEALCFFLIASNANGAATIDAPDVAGTMFVLRNGSGQSLTLMKSGGTGIAVANAKSALLYHNGTDYVRATADQTH